MFSKKSLLMTTLALAVPSILQNLVANLSQMVDNLMIGSLQEAAISGVTITNQIYFIFMIVLFGIGGAAGIYMPQFKGINDKNRFAQAFRISLVFSMAVGVLFFVVLHFFPDILLRLFASETAVIDYAHEYLIFIGFSFLVFPISAAIGNALRFDGYIRLPLYISLVTVALNVVLNYLFIFGNGGFATMGVVGAGLATLIARILEAVIYIAMTFILRTDIKTLPTQVFSFEKELLVNFVKKGYGLVANEFFWSLGMQTLAVLYTKRISENIAAMSISNAIGNMIFVGMGGMSVAISIILGKHLGQGKFQEAKNDARKLRKYTSLTGLFLGVCVFLLSFLLFNFYDVAPQTLMNARYLLAITASFSFLFYLNASYFFILRAGGDTKSVLFMDAGFVWLVVIPSAFLVGRTSVVLPVHVLLINFLEFAKYLIARWLCNKDTWLRNLTVSEGEEKLPDEAVFE